jgi:adenylyltransferase/sulfurtransferase
MALSASQRGRYARHLLLPEIGLVGQERLVAARFHIPSSAHRAAADVARTYLSRAGLSESAEPSALELELPRPSSVDHDPALRRAAAALSGALSAVETVKAVLLLGSKGEPVDPFTLLSEDV